MQCWVGYVRAAVSLARFKRPPRTMMFASKGIVDDASSILKILRIALGTLALPNVSAKLQQHLMTHTGKRKYR